MRVVLLARGADAEFLHGRQHVVADEIHGVIDARFLVLLRVVFQRGLRVREEVLGRGENLAVVRLLRREGKIREDERAADDDFALGAEILELLPEQPRDGRHARRARTAEHGAREEDLRDLARARIALHEARELVPRRLGAVFPPFVREERGFLREHGRADGRAPAEAFVEERVALGARVERLIEVAERLVLVDLVREDVVEALVMLRRAPRERPQELDLRLEERRVRAELNALERREVVERGARALQVAVADVGVDGEDVELRLPDLVRQHACGREMRQRLHDLCARAADGDEIISHDCLTFCFSEHERPCRRSACTCRCPASETGCRPNSPRACKTRGR